MEVINLDYSDVKVEDFEKVFTVKDSNRGKSVGDVFQSLYSIKSNDEEFIFLTHVKFLEVATFFGKLIDKLIVSSNPMVFNTFPNVVDIQYGHQINNRFEIVGYACPWLSFYTNQNVPNVEMLTIPNVIDDNIIPFDDGDVFIAPQNSGGYITRDEIIQPIIEYFKSKGKKVWVNYEEFEGCISVQCNFATLIQSLRKKNVLIIGNRSGLLDILYFTVKNPMIALFHHRGNYWYNESQFNHEKAKNDFSSYMRDNVYDIWEDGSLEKIKNTF